jgi:hypothetical protein
LCVLKVHDDSPVEVRPKEGPSRLCSSPPASGEIRASKRGVRLSLGGCKPPVRSMKRSLPRREPSPKGRTGSRARNCRAKAMEGVKRLEMQPRGTPRRMGHGTVGQPSWEQERPVSVPAVRPLGRHPRWWTGSDEPDKWRPHETGESGAGVGAVHSTVEAVDNRTTVEGRGRTWSVCLEGVSAGECRHG